MIRAPQMSPKNTLVKAIMALVMLLSIATTPLHAITPEEQLNDPILEDRARIISSQLRCLVCQNQSIDDSSSDLARDLRLEVRNLLTQGFSDDKIMARIRSTYGDYVLLNPPFSMATGLLWAAPIILLLLGGLGLFATRHAGSRTKHIVPQPPVQPSSLENNAPSSSESGLSPKILLTGLVLIGVMTSGLYAMLGRPDLSAQPLAGRQAEIAEADQRERANDTALKTSLDDAMSGANQNPSSIENQLRLAMAAAEMGDHEIELKAIEKALILTDGNPSIKAIKAEALSRKAGGFVTIPARALIAEVLAARPDEPRALYLFGLSAYQDEDYITALDRWGQLQSIIMLDNPLAARVALSIAGAADRAGVPIPENTSPFTSSLAMAVDLSEEEREEMILSMVEGLEARLEENPDNPQGWDMLINARQTLSDTDGLIRALIAAADTYPDLLERQVIALEAIVLEQQETEYLDASLTLLERINIISPRGPQFLFFAGHFAVISGETALAISLWRNLEAQMDENNPLKARLRDQINTLQQN